NYGVRARSGVWVRRDALRTPGALDTLRARRSDRRTEPLAWRIQDRLAPPEWVEHDDNREAALLQRLLAQSPNDPGVLQALAEAPDHYGANFQLAMALRRAGQADAALAQFRFAQAMATTLRDEKTARLAGEEIAGLKEALDRARAKK